MPAKYRLWVLPAILVVFYGNIAYQSWKPSSLIGYEHAAASSLHQTSQKRIDYGARRALIAINEQKLGVHEATKGCNCGPRVDKYTAGLHQQWCAMFTSWVFKEAGSPFHGPDPKQPWRITNARQIAAYLKKNGIWYSREKIIRDHIQPRVGDIMIFWRGDVEGTLGHADIVVGVNPKLPGHASLVGGNLFDSVRYRESSYFAEYYGFLGFGRPKGEGWSKVNTSNHHKISSRHQQQTSLTALSQTITDPRLRKVFQTSP